MKFIKFIFSRFILVTFAIMLEFILISATILFVNNLFFWVRIVGSIINALIFLKIVNKKQNPEFKLPWLFVMIAFPMLGTILYLMLGRNTMTNRHAKYFNHISETCKDLIVQDKSLNASITEELGSYVGINNYLQNSINSKAHIGNRVSYFKLGELFYEDLLKELEKAKKFIFLEYYIIDNGIMWEGIHKILKQKASEGVEVRLIYDDFGSIGRLMSGYHKKLRKEGINCHKFNTFIPVLSGIHNNRDHRKIAIIDGNVAYTGGINIADEYINIKKPYRHWKDTAIKIEGSAVANFTILFLQMFDLNTKKISDYEKYVKINYNKFQEPGAVNPFGCGPEPFYKEQVAENNFLNIISAAKNYVYITTPYLIIDYNLTTALKNAAYRGVDVRIITPHIPDKKIVFNMTRSSYKTLLEAGVKIYEYTPGFIHSKELIADGEVAFVGTINMDYRSLAHHYECGAMLYKTPCIEDIKRDFDELFEISEEKTLENFRMGKFAQLLNALLSLFSSIF